MPETVSVSPYRQEAVPATSPTSLGAVTVAISAGGRVNPYVFSNSGHPAGSVSNAAVKQTLAWAGSVLARADWQADPQRCALGRAIGRGGVPHGTAPDEGDRTRNDDGQRQGALVGVFTFDVVQIIAAGLVLVCFLLAQANRVNPSGYRYLISNLAGSGAMAATAVSAGEWGFVFLEGVWALVSAWGLVQRLRGRTSKATS